MKQAAIPDTSKLPKQPVSKEFDAVRRTYQTMVDENIQALSWKEFQQKFQQAVRQYPQLFTEIRHNQPTITREHLKKWVSQQADLRRNNYGVSYDKYHESEHSYRDVEQLVIQLNRGAEADKILAEDSSLSQIVNMIGQASGLSGHPAGRNTVGWLRVDFVNEDYLFVDEIQSDLVNGVTQAQAFCRCNSFEEWYNEQNEGVRAQVDQIPGASQRFSSSKQQLAYAGYTIESLEEIKSKLTKLFEDWTEYALATILEIARSHSIKYVAVNSIESMVARDPSVSPAKVKMYYDNLAKSFGFKKEQINTEGISGVFWVRKASLRSYLTAR
jgi:hypothetical protein